MIIIIQFTFQLTRSLKYLKLAAPTSFTNVPKVKHETSRHQIFLPRSAFEMYFKNFLSRLLLLLPPQFPPNGTTKDIFKRVFFYSTMNAQVLFFGAV
jgi:hypothetical protein